MLGAVWLALMEILGGKNQFHVSRNKIIGGEGFLAYTRN